MKPSLAVSLAVGFASAGKNCAEDKGSWYCEAAERISYKNVGAEGSYDRVVSMDIANDKCEFEKQAFSGPLAPFDQDLSLHFRGPLVLKQFAVYKPSKTNAKRDRPLVGSLDDFNRDNTNQLAKKAVGDMVAATINGQVVSWVNEYDGLPHAASPTAAPEQAQATSQVLDAVAKAELSTTTITITVQPSVCPASSAVAPAASSVTSWITVSNDLVLATAPIPPSSTSSTAVSASAPAAPSSEPTTNLLDDSHWTQRAYYNMNNRTAEGLTFLNNLGVNGMTFASADGASGTGSAQVFEGELKSQQEIAIFSGVDCNAGNCGYSRPNSVAYEGFAGAEKAFFMEFSMPDDGASEGFNTNMPGIWVLNGKVPRTQQYGKCSCWASGCGEFDIFETLTPGDGRALSTFHKRHAGGSSDYFERPVDGFIKLAVIMSEDSITVQQLGGDFEFPQTIAKDEIDAIHRDENVSMAMANTIYDLGG